MRAVDMCTSLFYQDLSVILRWCVGIKRSLQGPQLEYVLVLYSRLSSVIPEATRSHQDSRPARTGPWRCSRRVCDLESFSLLLATASGPVKVLLPDLVIAEPTDSRRHREVYRRPSGAYHHFRQLPLPLWSREYSTPMGVSRPPLSSVPLTCDVASTPSL